MGFVELDAWQGRHQFKPGKSIRKSLGFAALEQGSANPFAGMLRVNKISTNSRRITERIEFSRVALRMRVTPEQSVPPAPSSATDDLTLKFHNKICSIYNQLCVDSKRPAKRPFHLLDGIILGAKVSRRSCNESL